MNLLLCNLPCTSEIISPRFDLLTTWFTLHWQAFSQLSTWSLAVMLWYKRLKCNFCGLWMSETKETTGSASLRGIKHPGKQGNFLNPDKSGWFLATVLLKCETPFSFVWVEQEAVSAVLPQRQSSLPPLCWLISQQYILAWIRSHWYRPQNSFTVNLHLKHLFTSTLAWFTVNFTHGQLLETTNAGSGFRIHPYFWCINWSNSSTFPETGIKLRVTRSIWSRLPVGLCSRTCRATLWSRGRPSLWTRYPVSNLHAVILSVKSGEVF